MSIAATASVLSLPHAKPELDASAFVAGGARLIGAVRLGPSASVWYNAVVRGDVQAVRIGARSNVQDGVAIHVDRDHAADIGEEVSIGHNAVVHGCRIGDGSLIGMGAVVLSGAVIGEECLVAAGAVVREGAVVPPRSLVAGVPAEVRRALTDDEVAALRDNARRYVDHASTHAQATPAG